MDVPKIQIADWLKLSPQQFFTLFLFAAIALGLLTFASDGLLENLGDRDLRSDYRTGLGLGLILAWLLSVERDYSSGPERNIAGVPPCVSGGRASTI